MRFKSILLSAFAILLSGCPLSQTPTPPPVPKSDDTVALDTLVAQTLQTNLQRRGLSTDLHGAWQILHGILAYGNQFRIDTPQGEQPAVDYLLSGGSLSGFEPASGNLFGDPPRPGLRMELQPSTKIGQGHRDQWLAVLVQSGVDESTQIKVGEKSYTIRDWINQAEYDVPLNLEAEYSWTLIVLTAFDDTDHTWQARDGDSYSTELLLEAELEQELRGSVCGGTHRLIGLAMALQKRRAEGAPITGVWQRAQQKVNDSIELARQNQNPDGSYSVEYLHRPGWTRDLGESLGTTGHVLEFLAFAAPDETLRQPWVECSVRRLCQILQQCESVDLECGVLYHALHGLAVYQARISQDSTL